jgi:hypothetical protein
MRKEEDPVATVTHDPGSYLQETLQLSRFKLDLTVSVSSLYIWL